MSNLIARSLRWPLLGCAALLAPALAFPTGCQTIPRHQFFDATANWQTRSGQLQYRSPKTTLIGDVLVRFSPSGDFELTFSKGPGVTLLLIRQDSTYARVEGPLARGRWEGKVAEAPEKFRGWLALRDRFLAARAQPTLRQTVGVETFVFQF